MQDKPLILAVDDEPSNLMLISAALQQNYTLALAKSAKLAEHFLERKKPSLILLDILMPEKDGLAFAEELKKSEETASFPIVFLTGVSDSEAREKANLLGAKAFIEKPINVMTLRNMIDDIFAEIMQ